MTMLRSFGGSMILNPFVRRSVYAVTGSLGAWKGLTAESDPITIGLQGARFRQLRYVASSPLVSVLRPGNLRRPVGSPITDKATPGGLDEAGLGPQCPRL